MPGLKSTACTLGFTAVDGLMMGTRGGAIDPGVMLFLMDEELKIVRHMQKAVLAKPS